MPAASCAGELRPSCVCARRQVQAAASGASWTGGYGGWYGNHCVLWRRRRRKRAGMQVKRLPVSSGRSVTGDTRRYERRLSRSPGRRHASPACLQAIWESAGTARAPGPRRRLSQHRRACHLLRPACIRSVLVLLPSDPVFPLPHLQTQSLVAHSIPFSRPPFPFFFPSLVLPSAGLLLPRAPRLPLTSLLRQPPAFRSLPRTLTRSSTPKPCLPVRESRKLRRRKSSRRSPATRAKRKKSKSCLHSSPPVLQSHVSYAVLSIHWHLLRLLSWMYCTLLSIACATVWRCFDLIPNSSLLHFKTQITSFGVMEHKTDALFHVDMRIPE